MQSKSKKYEEEIPSLLWGLDPVFSAFARLYIKDIKEMRESKQVPGIFFYNGHPVRQVDVVGIVVQTKERNACYNYGVDDSTGVINCVCWKNPVGTERPLSAFPSTPNDFNVLEQRKKLQEMISQKTKLEIGDVVRVRGHIRTYRQQREIQASAFYKVDDPVCDVQISRMLELPCLYREVYDKPFQVPEGTQSGPESLDFSNMLCEKVKGFLLQNRIQTFYQQELETIDTLVSLAHQPLPSATCQEVDSKSDPSSKRIHSIFKEAVRMLQEKGVVFHKPSSSKDLYHVTDHDKELLKLTLDVIKEDCRKPRHAEKGCHFLHVLSCVRQSYHPCLSEAVMHRVLELLESNSDVISTMEGYYTTF
ncbi:CST complex subunit STN1 isoform X1 [Nothoprocta perdicaria]|uniref:CST complex subunit STN1 n=1 Tax=Nothoprocta perdicaria TaxID=30464 RepID=A0A8C6ZN30_NOTPE|nr:CST complex subunit STN1 isoform X1 [Nothoprocta perdicaria]